MCSLALGAVQRQCVRRRCLLEPYSRTSAAVLSRSLCTGRIVVVVVQSLLAESETGSVHTAQSAAALLDDHLDCCTMIVQWPDFELIESSRGI